MKPGQESISKFKELLILFHYWEMCSWN